jgi:hypothetical protein
LFIFPLTRKAKKFSKEWTFRAEERCKAERRGKERERWKGRRERRGKGREASQEKERKNNNCPSICSVGSRTVLVSMATG